VDSLVIGLSHFHSFWRYAVLIAAVVAFVGALAGWLGSLPARPTARRAGLLYVIAIDLQAALGIVLWFLRGGMGQERPFRLEHPLIMILAVVAIHVGQVMAKRAKSDKGAAGIVAIAIAVSFVLVLVGIPGLVTGR
jgi:heme A synthase